MLENMGIRKRAVKPRGPVFIGDGKDCSEEGTGRL